MLNYHYFQLLKNVRICWFSLFYILYDYKLNIFGFWPIGKTKHFERRNCEMYFCFRQFGKI